MMDGAMVAIGIILFVVSVAYVQACDLL